MRKNGHTVDYIAEADRSASDTDILSRADSQNQLLLTEDKDFGELVFRQRKSVPGIVLLRLGTEQPSMKWNRLNAAIQNFGEELFGRYTVVGDKRIRSRRLPFRFD